MECGFDAPEHIAACIHVAKRWFQVVVDLIGLGTFALITYLLWSLNRLRTDIVDWERNAASERALRAGAENAMLQAKHRADLAERQLGLARRDREELQSTLQAGSDQVAVQLAEISDIAYRRCACNDGEWLQSILVTSGRAAT
jgi:hypothetical protein